MIILMVSMGYAVPAVINKMIRRDVEKDVNSRKTVGACDVTFYAKSKMEDFTKKLKN